MTGRRQLRIGRVVSNKMMQTVVVAVETRRPHPHYRRIVRVVKKYKAHDEANACAIGDVVRIEETRPLSKEKRWRVAEILSQERLPRVEAELDLVTKNDSDLHPS
ncbi:MAG: 30S ribosomal protein S17 [Chloroflexi bacterium]|nr:30S ribosomal protein S17 [Chloroflexota bacterium]